MSTLPRYSTNVEARAWAAGSGACQTCRVLIVAAMAFAASLAIFGWGTHRYLSANPTSRIAWWSRSRNAQPRWNVALCALGAGIFGLTPGSLAREQERSWVYLVAAIPVIAVTTIPIWTHNRRVKHGGHR
jgi:hypothetical protein